jgi:hypothetical protein
MSTQNETNKTYLSLVDDKITEVAEKVSSLASPSCTLSMNTRSTQTYHLSKELKTLRCLRDAIAGVPLNADFMTTITRTTKEVIRIDINVGDDVIEYMMKNPKVSIGRIDEYIANHGMKREGTKIVETVK